MRSYRFSLWMLIGLAVGCLCASGRAQAPPDDENLAPIRNRPNIGATDQRLINEWVLLQIDKFAAAAKTDAEKAFVDGRERFNAQYKNSSNSDAFKTQLALQTVEVAQAQMAKPSVDPSVTRLLARVLVDMDRMDMVPALLSGLSAKDQATRYLCARGLSAKKATIAADKEALEKTVSALREAGLSETNSVVLGQVYSALNYPLQQAAAVMEAYLAIFDKRVALRRGPGLVVDGAEIDAFEFFRTTGVSAALNAEQKARLVSAVAVFLRADAERYSSESLPYDELETLERRLDAEESVLADLGGKGGDIRGELAAGGHEKRGEVLKQAYLWVGDSAQKNPGALNAAPWNVPIGAP